MTSRTSRDLVRLMKIWKRSMSSHPPAVKREVSYWHTVGSEPLTYKTLGQSLECAAEKFANREAIVSVHEGVRLSYKDLLLHVDRVAAGLHGLGLNHGERIALWGPNGWQWVVCRLAAARAGLVAVDINPLYQANEVSHCLSVTNVAAIIAAEKHRSQIYHDILSAVVPELPDSASGSIRSAALPHLRLCVTLSHDHLPGTIRYVDVVSSVTPEGLQKVQQLQTRINPDSALSIQFSSGTTGKPKAILTSHVNVVNNARHIGKRLGLDRQIHRVCVQVPLFHVFGSVVGMTSSFEFGAAAVFPSETYNAKETMSTVIEERCTVLTGTPTMYVDAVDAVEESGKVPTSLDVALIGGAPAPSELARRILSTLRVKWLCNSYGLTETSAIVFQSQHTDTVERTTNTVGKCGDHVEVKVVDSEGYLVPFGTPGELWVRGFLTMKEYYEDQAASENIFQNGWLRTGDIFILSEDGYGLAVGRIKDVIIRGGENIYPAEVESVLLSHPDIIDVQVVPVPDQRLGEELCACLRVRQGCTMNVKQIRDFCQGLIATFKIPRYSHVMSEFPKTQSGKVQKYKLREVCEELQRLKLLDDFRNVQ